MKAPERNPIYHYSEATSPLPPVCAVCKFQLIAIPAEDLTQELRQEGLPGSVYVVIHLQKDADHLPEPMKHNRDDDVNFVCDFCSDTPIHWSYPATSFDVEFAPNESEFLLREWGSADDWAACDACHQSIQGDDWQAIIDRLMKREAIPEPLAQEARKRTQDLFDRFRAHRMGPPTRLES